MTKNQMGGSLMKMTKDGQKSKGGVFDEDDPKWPEIKGGGL